VTAKERTFELPALRLAAKEWGAPPARPVLALHGWLDNAASFDRLAPRLDGCHVVALDSAGHGYSGSRPAGAAYNLWQEVGDILDVADQLGWQRLTLIGHSRGAAVSMLFAGAFPERIDKLVLLEGGIPLLGRPEDAPADLARAMIEIRQLSRKTGRVFASEAEAIEERANGFSKVTLDAAALLARRSLRRVDGGYRWHADQRLKAGSELRLTAEQVRAFLAAITAPVLTIVGERSFFSKRPEYLEMLEALDRGTLVRLTGGHHFHMEGAEGEIARLVLEFFGQSGYKDKHA
jgi:pimeloyl-ACP methyl ester carboxylesterase